jgi:4-carboxymuconolactone decarboxylase
MPRLPSVSIDELSPDQRETYAHIARVRGATDAEPSVPLPFQVLLNSPDAAAAVASLDEYLRFSSRLDPVIRETAILSAAREMGSQYEWAHHEPLARQVGVRDEVIESIRTGKAPMGLPAKEGVFAQAAKEMVAKGTLTDRTFEAVLHLLGPQDTVDLIVLIGYYTMIVRVINALGIELEPELSPGLPQ